MAITTLAQLQTAKQQLVTISKIGPFTGSASVFASMFDVGGQPVGTLVGSNTANGIVPTSSDVGYPYIKPFANGSQGYLKTINASNSSFSRICLFDRLFFAGTYSFNANVTLTSQPSFASRVPNGDYAGLEIWTETVTGFNGSPVCTIGYTNESGIGSRIATASVSTSSRVSRPVSLQAGDRGVQKIDSVTLTGSTVGEVNVMILRRLHDSNILENVGIDRATMFDGFVLEPIYSTSALYLLSLGVGVPQVNIQIAEG